MKTLLKEFALALLLFPATETMSPQFYYGAILILITVLLDGVFKNFKIRKRKRIISTKDN